MKRASLQSGIEGKDAEGQQRTRRRRTGIEGNKDGPERPNIRDPPVQRQNDRQPPEEHDTDHENDQSPGGESEVVIVELVERKDGSDVDESGSVEEQIDDVGEVGLFGLFVEEPTGKGQGGRGQR